MLFQHSEFELIFYGDKHGIKERWMCLHDSSTPNRGYRILNDDQLHMLPGCYTLMLIKHQNRCFIQNKDAFLGRTCFLLIWARWRICPLDDQQIDGTKWCSRVSFAAFALVPRKRTKISPGKLGLLNDPYTTPGSYNGWCRHQTV